jgi:hypothetical protein
MNVGILFEGVVGEDATERVFERGGAIRIVAAHHDGQFVIIPRVLGQGTVNGGTGLRFQRGAAHVP